MARVGLSRDTKVRPILEPAKTDSSRAEAFQDQGRQFSQLGWAKSGRAKLFYNFYIFFNFFFLVNPHSTKGKAYSSHAEPNFELSTI